MGIGYFFLCVKDLNINFLRPAESKKGVWLGSLVYKLN